MPCGGIYPSKVPERYTCWHCNCAGTDHWCDEWDAPLHGKCVVPFLATVEGQIVVDHKHAIQIDDFVLQEEGGAYMDPTTALENIREVLERLQEETESDDGASADVETLVTSFGALDDWLSRGGFLPLPWGKCRPMLIGDVDVLELVTCTAALQVAVMNTLKALDRIGGMIKEASSPPDSSLRPGGGGVSDESEI